MLRYTPVERIFEIKGFHSAFCSKWDENFSFGGENHDFWEAVYVKDGSVEVVENENIYVLEKGDMIFHAPMEFHRIKSAGGSSPTVFIMTFSVLGELPSALNSGVFSLEPSFSGDYEKICKAVLDFRADSSNALLGQELTDRLSIFLVKLSSRPHHGEGSMAGSAIEYRKVVSLMSESVMENLTVSDIAKKSNLSVSYIKLLFKLYAGVSPKCYFNQLRIRRATDLLRMGESVSAIAAAMNFSSSAYFSAFYKKLTGMSASEQRKNTP